MRFLILAETIEGKLIENVICKKGKGFVEKVYIDGEFWDEHKIYKVNTDAPYVRAYTTKFFFTGDDLKAFKEFIKEAA